MDNIYETRSLQIAAFLFTQGELGVKLVGYNQKDPRNIYFQFEPKDKASELEDAYLMDKIDVKPRTLFEAFGTLKEKVFHIQRSVTKN